MKRIRESDTSVLAEWASALELPVEKMARLVSFLETKHYAIVPEAVKEEEEIGGVCIKYELSNPFGPNVKEKEYMPRHVLRFLDLVCPSIDVKMQEHQYEEFDWFEIGNTEKPSDLVSDDEDWKEVGNGRWHDAVFGRDHLEKAYRYFYEHRGEDDVDEQTLEIANKTTN